MLLFVADNAGRYIIEYATVLYVHMYVYIQYTIDSTQKCVVSIQKCARQLTGILASIGIERKSVLLILFPYLLTSVNTSAPAARACGASDHLKIS